MTIKVPPEAAKLLDDFRYSNSSDVNMRLNKSIIKYRGRPIYVHHVYENLTIHAHTFGVFGPNDLVLHSSDVDLDISSPTIGWVNHPTNGPVYLMRTARNSQKQGLVPTQCQTLWPTMSRHKYAKAGYGWQQVNDLLPIVECINGEYPPIAHVVKFKNGMAIHREWALATTGQRPGYYTVYHKTIPVGTYNSKTRTFFFRRGRLTKTRRYQLEEIFGRIENAMGGSFGIKEQL